MESCIYLGWLLFIGMQKPIISTLKALSPPYRVFLVTLVILLIGGQLVDRGRETFPFVGWSMYALPVHGDPQYYDYTMVSESEWEMRLEVFRLAGSLSYRLMCPLKSLPRNMASDPDGPWPQAMITDYERALEALPWTYNRRNIEDPIQTIRVWDCTIPLHQYRNPRRSSAYYSGNCRSNSERTACYMSQSCLRYWTLRGSQFMVYGSGTC